MSFRTNGQHHPHSRNFAITARTNWAQAYQFLSFFSWKMEGMGEQGHFWPMTIQCRNSLDTAGAHSCCRQQSWDILNTVMTRYNVMISKLTWALFSPHTLHIPVSVLCRNSIWQGISGTYTHVASRGEHRYSWVMVVFFLHLVKPSRGNPQIVFTREQWEKWALVRR